MVLWRQSGRSGLVELRIIVCRIFGSILVDVDNLNLYELLAGVLLYIGNIGTNHDTFVDDLLLRHNHTLPPLSFLRNSF